MRICARKRRNVLKLVLLALSVLAIVALWRNANTTSKNRALFNSFESLDVNQSGVAAKNVQVCGRPLLHILDDFLYPHCAAKLQWLHQNWQSHQCYAANGVDGTDCALYNYMSTKERFCRPQTAQSLPEPPDVPSALTIPDLQTVLAHMNDSTNYEFIKRRITELWPDWINAREELLRKRPEAGHGPAKKFIFFLGLISDAKNNLAAAADRGGPLGELVQWSDLIAALSVLGHQVQIYSRWPLFKRVIPALLETPPCPNDEPAMLIFTDIMGLRKVRGSRFYLAHRCRFRVLDSFGTHAEFNHPHYFNAHKDQLNYQGGLSRKKNKNPWGANGLNLRQFLTLYPHSDDNTFLGFVVRTFGGDEPVERENITVVYGKEAYMWKDAAKVLEVAANFTRLHATVENYEAARAHAGRAFDNHGTLSVAQFQRLLRRAKVFLGLGFPIEGPAPLEAVANGAIFINPRFRAPKSRLNYAFFAEKPTLREITSQNFYMDRFVSKPYVITVDIDDETALRNAFKQAMETNLTPTLPYEFSVLGMLERVHIIVDLQDLCSGRSAPYPPFERAGHIRLAVAGRSCEAECAAHGLLCEHTFFPHVNNRAVMTRHSCPSGNITYHAQPYSPFGCQAQADPLLFSCATVPPAHVQRLCPCRTFKRNQTALCEEC